MLYKNSCEMELNMKEQLEKAYNNLFVKYNLKYGMNAGKIAVIIKNSIVEFLKNTKNPAIYCNGGHTRMLMSDFINELKTVRIIVDNYSDIKCEGGYTYITDKDIEKYEIDAIIISSFKYRKNIFNELKSNHKNIKVLDIYSKLEEKGIKLESDYYYCNHPYHKYHTINNLQNKIKTVKDDAEGITLEKLYIDLITYYLQIKDFRTAVNKIKELCDIVDNKKYKELLKDSMDLYAMELEAFKNISSEHVLMLCLDGLRRTDLKSMKKTYAYLNHNSYMFENAYSCSTSTYESLVPAYSGNDDMRTRYYENNSVNENECDFLQLANQQNRTIHVYGDVFHYFDGKNVEHEDVYQTITEKIWSFTIDAMSEEKGLYYIHELYESHFSFSNPYTEAKLISEGTALLFDFLPYKGGKLRTDYKKQHDDSLRYLDDVMYPFIERLNANMVLYADHGNLILDKECTIEQVENLDYLCSEQWIQIPLVIKSKNQENAKDNTLISLICIGDIIKKLLKGEKYIPIKKQYIKIMRSELYNPDFKYLYKSISKEKYLMAFEAFIIDNRYKFIIFSDTEIELYELTSENQIYDEELINDLKKSVLEDVTVCRL